MHRTVMRLCATIGGGSAATAPLSPKRIVDDLRRRRTEAFFGVPHRTLQPLAAYVMHHTSPYDHSLCTNTEQAVGLAVGHFAVTGKPPCVYVGEEAVPGLIRPLLTFGIGSGDKSGVAAAPPIMSCLLLIGCGAGGGMEVKGPGCVESILDGLCVPHRRLSQSALVSPLQAWEATLNAAYAHLAESKGIYAVLVDAAAVEAHRTTAAPLNAIDGLTLSLSTVAEQVARQVNAKDIVVCASGALADRLHSARHEAGHDVARTVIVLPPGADVASVAAGVALASAETAVYSVQTDEQATPHLAAWACQAHTAAALAPSAAASPLTAGPLGNLRHIVINSGAYLCDGGAHSMGLPTPAFDASIAGIAKACGCALVREEPVLDVGELVGALGDMRQAVGPCLLEVVVVAPPPAAVASASSQ